MQMKILTPSLSVWSFMKACISPHNSGIDALQYRDIAAPGAVTAGQVKVAVKAASLNYRDLLVLSGALGKPQSDEGLIMCSDGAGEVIEVAPDVERFKVGDRVAMTFLPDWIGGPFRTLKKPYSLGQPLNGVMREQMVVKESELVYLPSHLSYGDGATLPCAAVTAWRALCGDAPLYPGMSVLLQGGGGVSVFGIQFAKLFGARVIVTSSTDERCDRLRALGADDAINYTTCPEWQDRVREVTKGEGVDLAIDLGGAGTVDRNVQSLKKGGRLSLVGLLDGWPQGINGLFAGRVKVTPVSVGSRDDFELMNRAIEFHKLKPVIDRVFAFDELPQALRYLETGKQFGKIVISF